jgi:hypothetical protein
MGMGGGRATHPPPRGGGRILPGGTHPPGGGGTDGRGDPPSHKAGVLITGIRMKLQLDTIDWLKLLIQKRRVCRRSYAYYLRRISIQLFHIIYTSKYKLQSSIGLLLRPEQNVHEPNSMT